MNGPFNKTRNDMNRIPNQTTLMLHMDRMSNFNPMKKKHFFAKICIIDRHLLLCPDWPTLLQQIQSTNEFVLNWRYLINPSQNIC